MSIFNCWLLDNLAFSHSFEITALQSFLKVIMYRYIMWQLEIQYMYNVHVCMYSRLSLVKLPRCQT